MKNQPVLTNFPRTIFATATRRLQAAISRQRQRITQSSLSGYALLFDFVLPAEFLRHFDPTKRQRHFGQLVVFWAWLAQILEINASCSRALGLVQSWCQANALPVPTGDTGAYCRARQRFSISFLKKIFTKTKRTLYAGMRERDRWRGHTLKAIDGTSVTLMDTPKNQLSYPQHGSSKPGCGFPIMGMVGIVNLSHGGVEGFETCEQSSHDARTAPQLLKHLDEGDLLLGDRAFCSYEFIARIITERNGHVLMRLHQARHRVLDWRKGKKLSPIERLVTWSKPPQQPKNSELTAEQWQALPATLTLRYIKQCYENRAGERDELVVATDLLDGHEYDAVEMADLYMRRWEIEVRFRDLKTTLGFERFEVKSPEMAQKTLWMTMIAYNLIRSLMQRAAREAGKPIHHMSFKGTLDVAASSHESFRPFAGKPRKLAQHREAIIAICATKQLEIRPFRQEPRAVKRRPKNYQWLTKHRHIFKEIPHRETYRKPA